MADHPVRGSLKFATLLVVAGVSVALHWALTSADAPKANDSGSEQDGAQLAEIGVNGSGWRPRRGGGGTSALSSGVPQVRGPSRSSSSTDEPYEEGAGAEGDDPDEPVGTPATEVRRIWADLSTSGPAPRWAGDAESNIRGFFNTEGIQGRLLDARCFAGGCYFSVAASNPPAYDRLISQLRESPEYAAWPGGKVLAGAVENGTGEVESAWVYLPPDQQNRPARR